MIIERKVSATLSEIEADAELFSTKR